MRVGIIIQARMESTRFPGKILADLAGKPMLQRVIERLKRVPKIDELIVATSDRSSDDAIATHCSKNDISCFRGFEEDVLRRYADAAECYDLDVIIRACGDAPLTDPPGIEELIRVFHNEDTRFVHNRHPDGWPAGTAADLMSRDALDEAVAKADKPHHREHVVPFMYEHPDCFGMKVVYAPADLRRPEYDLAVDFKEELALICRIYRTFGNPDPAQLSLQDVVSWLDQNRIKTKRPIWPSPN